MKRCGKCGETKPSTEFYPKTDRPCGLSSQCKACTKEYRQANSERTKKYLRTYQQENAEALKSRKLEKSYGISREDYHRILAEQNGCCAMCHADNPGRKGSFHVDHDHETGVVRGLLCHSCNVGLGHLGDDPITASARLYNYALRVYPQRLAN